MKKELYSLLSPFCKFKANKHKMVLPEIDSIAIAMVYKGKMYGGFVKVDFNDEVKINRVFEFLVKTGKNKVNELKESK